MSATNIMIVGVGGQGSVIATTILGRLLVQGGYDVKVSEVHGMSQRGGSVVTYVRYGDKVYAPLVDKGQCDCIVSFETLEAARWMEYLKPGGRLIVNDQRIDPMPVITGSASYPENIVEKIREKGYEVDAIDAKDIAVKAVGNAVVANLVLMGRMSKHFDFTDQQWFDAMPGSGIPDEFLEMNKTAFLAGKASE